MAISHRPLLGRSIIFPRWDVQTVDQRAVDINTGLLVHVVLFDGPAVLSDSNISNNVLLRAALRKKGIARGLVAEGLLAAACRESDSGLLPLASLAQAQKDSGSRAPIFEQVEFDDLKDLDWFDSRGSKMPFRIPEAASYYTTTILRIIEDCRITDDQGIPMPDDIRMAVLEEAQVAVERGEQLGAAFFARKNTMGEALLRRFGSTAPWSRWGATLDFLANTPSMTFWADEMGAVPVYRQQHARSMQLWRSMKAQTEPRLVESRSFTAQLSLSSYVAGLNCLTIEDVLDLRASEESRNWFATLNGANEKTPLEDIQGALEVFRYRIDRMIGRRWSGVELDGGEFQTSLSVLDSSRKHRAASSAAKGLVLNFLDKALLGGLAGHLDLAGSLVMTLLGRDSGSQSARTANEEAAADSLRIQKAMRDISIQPGEKSPVIRAEETLQGPHQRDTLLGVQIDPS